MVNSRVHILTQYVWPDSAVTAIYAEQLADALRHAGMDVVLVGGVGRFRESRRPKPQSHIVRLEHFCGRRNSLFQVAVEYGSVSRAFTRYIENHVCAGEVVIMGSFPPNTTGLFSTVERQGAVGVYWLQDYYPDYFRSVWNYPRPVEYYLENRWSRHLRRWPVVVKIAENMGYEGSNVRIIRNWPTLALGLERAFIPKTALYTGNLGLAHSVEHLTGACEVLRDEGYEITFYADGHGVAKLPSWVRKNGMLGSEAVLVDAMWSAEIHLVAADPRFQRSLFPSKFWNCRATGRKILCTGFEGAIARELEIARKVDYRTHLGQWIALVQGLMANSPAPAAVLLDPEAPR